MTGDDIRQLAEDIWEHDTSSEKARLLTYAVLFGWAARLDLETSRDPQPTAAGPRGPHPQEGGPHADSVDQAGVLAIR